MLFKIMSHCSFDISDGFARPICSEFGEKAAARKSQFLLLSKLSALRHKYDHYEQRFLEIPDQIWLQKNWFYNNTKKTTYSSFL